MVERKALNPFDLVEVIEEKYDDDLNLVTYNVGIPYRCVTSMDQYDVENLDINMNERLRREYLQHLSVMLLGSIEGAADYYNRIDKILQDLFNVSLQDLWSIKEVEEMKSRYREFQAMAKEYNYVPKDQVTSN